MRGERNAGLSLAGDDGQHILGKAGLERELPELDHRQRRELARLADDDVPARESRGDLLRGDQERVVPRRDGGADPDGHPLGVVQVVALDGDGRAFDLVAPAGEIAVPAGDDGLLGACLPDRASVVPGLELSQPRGVLLQEVGEPVQDPSTFPAVQTGPRWKSPPGAADGSVDCAVVGILGLGEHLPRRRALVHERAYRDGHSLSAPFDTTSTWRPSAAPSINVSSAVWACSRGRISPISGLTRPRPTASSASPRSSTLAARQPMIRSSRRATSAAGAWITVSFA